MQVIENCAAKRQVPARAARQTMPLYGTNGPAGSSRLATTAHRRYVVYQKKAAARAFFFEHRKGYSLPLSSRWASLVKKKRP
jgi:hypothetical protein